LPAQPRAFSRGRRPAALRRAPAAEASFFAQDSEASAWYCRARAFCARASCRPSPSPRRWPFLNLVGQGCAIPVRVGEFALWPLPRPCFFAVDGCGRGTDPGCRVMKSFFRKLSPGFLKLFLQGLPGGRTDVLASWVWAAPATAQHMKHRAMTMEGREAAYTHIPWYSSFLGYKGRPGCFYLNHSPRRRKKGSEGSFFHGLAAFAPLPVGNLSRQR